MDPSLLLEHEKYCKRAVNAPPVVAHRRTAQFEPTDSCPRKKAKPEQGKPQQMEFEYQTANGRFKCNFGALAKIVQYLKLMHQKGAQAPIPLNDILEETCLTGIGDQSKLWLTHQALVNNPKVEVVGDAYRFKAVYNIYNEKGLLNLLRQNEENGNGCIMVKNIEELIPNFTKVIKDLKDSVIQLCTEKIEVLYYRNKDAYSPVSIEADITKCWHSISVKNTDEQHFAEYLREHGMTETKTLEIKKPTVQKMKPSKNMAKPLTTHNEHMGDVLKNYSAK